MPVQMKLARIIISEINEQQIIYLREVDGDRQFPILIGIFEATSIDRRVKDYEPPRPLTHDLLVNSIEILGGELDSVVCRSRRHSGFLHRRAISLLRVRALSQDRRWSAGRQAIGGDGRQRRIPP